MDMVNYITGQRNKLTTEKNIREEFQCCYNWANSHVFSRCSFLIKVSKD